MLRFLKMMMLFILTAGFIAACSDGGGGSSIVPLITDTTGTITADKKIEMTGVTGTVPKGLVLKDASGNPLVGNLTMTITSPSTTGITPPAGTTTAAYITFKITDPTGKEAKTFAGTPNSFAVTIDVAGAKAGDVLNLYTSNDGTSWVLDPNTPTITLTTDGKATITITHLSYWGVFKASTATNTVSGKAVQSIPSGGTTPITDGVAIQLSSFDKNGIELDKISTSSDAAGGVSAALKQSPAGGYITIKATKEGYTEFQKRIDYSSPGSVEFQAVLDNTAQNTIFATPGTPLAAGLGKSSVSSFNFAVVRYPNGAKKALSGTAIKAAKAAGAVTEVGISIPQDTVPGVSKLKGELMTYDPNSQSDRFPGSYNGVDASGKEGKMVSLAFDSLKISNADTGENIGKLAQKLAKAGVSKAAAKTTTYTRSIYSSSCENLFLEDYDTTAAGYQVPVWSLNPYNGKWIMIGVGDVVDSNGALISAPTKASCQTGNYYLKILVSNSEFQQSWWNLDHIIFSTPTQACLSGNFKFTDGTGVSGLSLSLNGSNIEGVYGRTDTDGAYALSTVLLNKNSSNLSAKLYYYDDNGMYQTQDVTLGTTPCGSFSKTDIAKPCDVSGKLVDDVGAAAAYRYLRMQSSDYSFYRSVGTDSNGDFSARVACGKDIDVYVGSMPTKSATFDVNSTVGSDETSDASNKVVLKNITVPNIPPNGYAYFTMSSIKLGGTLSAILSAYDEDNNYPLSYSLKLMSGASAIDTKTGTIAATDPQPISVNFTGLAVGSYTATLEIKDSKNASQTITLGTVTVSDGSRPPVVDLFADRLNLSTCSTNRIINLYGSAFDPDGDGLAGAWSRGGVAMNCPGGSGINGTLAASCQDSIPTTAGPFLYSFTVTDNSTLAKSAFKEVSINTINNRPWVQLTSNKNLVVEGSTGADRIVTLTANGYDADGDALTGSWTVDGSPITSCSGGSGTGSITASCAFTIPTTATLGQAFTFAYTAADCASNGSNSVKVTYGAAGDVNVVVQ